MRSPRLPRGSLEPMNPYWWLLAALIAVNLAVLPYFLFLLATSLAAISRRPREQLGSDDPSSKFLIVIPAHNEQSGIATTVRSCLEANYPSLLFGVTVIADNCTDQTAALAREAGARVCRAVRRREKEQGVRHRVPARVTAAIGRARLAGRRRHRRCRHHDRPQPAALVRPGPAPGPRLDAGLLHRGQSRPIVAHAADDLCIQHVQRRDAVGSKRPGLERGLQRQWNVLLDPRPAPAGPGSRTGWWKTWSTRGR